MKKAKKKTATKKASKIVKKAAPKKVAKPKAAADSKPVVGKAAPHFSLASTSGESISLKSLKGKFVVLYFYPRDATPGCTQEGHEFSKLAGQFKSANCEVFGISRDTLKSHEKFKEKEKYTIDLLADVDETACNAFGVMKMKNMYGKQVRGVERSTFVIDTDGEVVKEWRGVKVPGHAAEVLKFVKDLT